MKKKIKQDSSYLSVFEPTVTLKDKMSVLSALNKKYISGTSPIIREFENRLENQFSSNKAVAVSNGSVALDLAFQLLDLNENDEVVLPSFTIISCLAAVVRSKAKPIFCDVDSNSWNMTLQNVKDVITENTKAILMVHTYGLTAEAKAIKEFCKDNNLLLIEDAAEAHGQTVNDQLCGTFGDIATLSFYANKHMTTGEGGALLINDEMYYDKALKMRNLDFDNSRRFQHENFYWNYRLSGLQAALGISQISSIEKTIEKKIKQASIYNNILAESEKLQIPLISNQGSRNHYWVYGVILKSKSRDELSNYLHNEGIQTRNFFWPLHMQNVLKEEFKPKDSLQVSESLGRQGLYIPMGAHLSKHDQMRIARKLLTFVDG
jgi:perosamine synthetase